MAQRTTSLALALAAALGGGPAAAGPPPDLAAARRLAASEAPEDRRAALVAAAASSDAAALDVVLDVAATARRARAAAAAAWARDGEALVRATDALEREDAAFARRAAPDAAARARHAARREALRDDADALEVATEAAARAAADGDDELDRVRRVATTVLGRRPPEELAAALRRLEAAWLTAPGATASDGARFVEVLEAQRDPEVARRLQALATDPARDPRVRAAALAAAADRHDDGALTTAVGLLGDGVALVSAAAVDALRVLHEPAAIPALIRFLEGADLGRRREDACRALRSLTGESHGPYAEPWRGWWDDARADFQPPRRAAPFGPLVLPPAGVTFYGVTTFSDRVVFVLDTSGSMAEPSGGPGRAAAESKLAVARRELFGALDGLDPRRGRFAVLLFDRQVRRHAPGLLAADLATRGAAKTWVGARAAAGETNLHDALREAFRLAGAADGPWPAGGAADTVFLLTDGKPTAGGVRDRDRLVDAVRRWHRLTRATLHAVGVGAHDGPLLQSLATLTGGLYVRR